MMQQKILRSTTETKHRLLRIPRNNSTISRIHKQCTQPGSLRIHILRIIQHKQPRLGTQLIQQNRIRIQRLQRSRHQLRSIQTPSTRQLHRALILLQKQPRSRPQLDPPPLAQRLQLLRTNPALHRTQQKITQRTRKAHKLQRRALLLRPIGTPLLMMPQQQLANNRILLRTCNQTRQHPPITTIRLRSTHRRSTHDRKSKRMHRLHPHSYLHIRPNPRSYTRTHSCLNTRRGLLRWRQKTYLISANTPPQGLRHALNQHRANTRPRRARQPPRTTSIQDLPRTLRTALKTPSSSITALVISTKTKTNLRRNRRIKTTLRARKHSPHCST